MYDKRIMSLIALAVAALILILPGCGKGKKEPESTEKPAQKLSGTVKVSGSTTVLPLAQEAAGRFMDENSGVDVEVQGGGSSVGITQVKEGVVDIGMSSRDLKPEEDDGSLVDHKIALDIIAVIVHPEVGVTNLTAEQVKAIFTGQVKKWSDVGGSGGDIVVVVRDKASGTREMFDEKALGSSKDAPVEPVASAIECNSNGMVRETVASTKNAIGYISIGYVDETVKTVKYNDVEPTLSEAKADRYPLSRYLRLFTKGEPSGAVKAFIDYMLSDSFQRDVVSKDYIPAYEF